MGMFCDKCEKHRSAREYIYSRNTLAFDGLFFRGDLCKNCRKELVKEIIKLGKQFKMEMEGEVENRHDI